MSPRRTAVPLPDYRRATHAKAVAARLDLAGITGALRYDPPHTAEDWHQLQRLATRASRTALDLATVCRDAAAALEAGEA